MIEEPEQPFPPVEDETTTNSENPNNHETILEDPEEDEDDSTKQTESKTIDDQQNDAQCPISSSTCSDGETTGPSTAENSQSHAPPSDEIPETKQVVGGRASIPDELEPHQLARLQDLKESNA